jgi:hypothetical protein
LPWEITLASELTDHTMTSRARAWQLLRLCALVVALAACSQSVVVQADFPEPVVSPLPLVVGLKYPEALTGYVYTEEVPNDYAWTFDIGAANTSLFDSVFLNLFERTVRIDPASGSPAPADVDAVIEPSLEAFEFSLPRQSRTDQYAVWIRYNLTVFSPDGEVIVSWPVSAYGQSDSRAFKANRSMELATIRAMRDAAATIALGFEKQAKIRDALLKESANEES